MEARRGLTARTAVRFLLSSLCLVALARTLSAASYRTANFEVHAPTSELARELGKAAEEYRRTLAHEWLGYELPQWEEQCPIHARIARGAGGETSFYFTRGRVHGWRMVIQGSPERMLDSVLPHEVTHTIFATHFRQPLPRWADEGACTTVEHPAEIARMERELVRFLKTRRGIRFSDMMWMKQYPNDFMPLYAQGHSVAKYLIAQRGKRAFVKFLKDGMQDDNWPRAAREHYGFTHLAEMQNQWLDWVRAGHPTPDSAVGSALLASNQEPATEAESESLIVRGQEPDPQSPRVASSGVHRQVALSNTPDWPTEASDLDAIAPPDDPAGPVISSAVATYVADSSHSGSAGTRPRAPLIRSVPVSTSAASGRDSVLFHWRAPEADHLYRPATD